MQVCTMPSSIPLRVSRQSPRRKVSSCLFIPKPFSVVINQVKVTIEQGPDHCCCTGSLVMGMVSLQTKVPGHFLQSLHCVPVMPCRLEKVIYLSAHFLFLSFFFSSLKCLVPSVISSAVGSSRWMLGIGLGLISSLSCLLT